MPRHGDLRRRIETYAKEHPAMSAVEVTKNVGGSYPYVSGIIKKMKDSAGLSKPAGAAIKNQSSIVQRYIRDISDLLSFLPKEERRKAVNQIMEATGLNIKDWITLVPFPQRIG